MNRFIIFYIFTLICVCPSHVKAQKEINQIINTMKEAKSFFGLTLPGWLIKKVYFSTKDKEVESSSTYDLDYIFKNTKSIRFAYSSIKEEAHMTSQIIHDAIRNFVEKHQFHEGGFYKKGNDRVSILIKEKSGKVEQILLLTQSNTHMGVLQLKTSLFFDKISQSSLLKINKSLTSTKSTLYHEN